MNWNELQNILMKSETVINVKERLNWTEKEDDDKITANNEKLKKEIDEPVEKIITN